METSTGDNCGQEENEGKEGEEEMEELTEEEEEEKSDEGGRAEYEDGGEGVRCADCSVEASRTTLAMTSASQSLSSSSSYSSSISPISSKVSFASDERKGKLSPSPSTVSMCKFSPPSVFPISFSSLLPSSLTASSLCS